MVRDGRRRKGRVYWPSQGRHVRPGLRATKARRRACALSLHGRRKAFGRRGGALRAVATAAARAAAAARTAAGCAAAIRTTATGYSTAMAP